MILHYVLEQTFHLSDSRVGCGLSGHDKCEKTCSWYSSNQHSHSSSENLIISKSTLGFQLICPDQLWFN